MAKQEVSSVQIQMAASAGVQLLKIDDLPVPMNIAKSGALSILEGMLQALASGEVVLAPPAAEAPPAEPPAPEKIAEAGDDPAIAPVESAEG